MKVLESKEGHGVFLIQTYKCVFDAIKWFADQLGSEDLDESILEKSLTGIAIETGVSLFPAILEVMETDKVMSYRVINLDGLKLS
ncbi:hypothetical protein CPT_Moabite_073 [Serratia phage Moabite]|uniref:Uncharacterized protein n=3 Tax=Moabitevirus TaxID=2843422 RepID=A0A7T3NBS8_9CAUD|nr:hypothetical protein HWB23_gp349 [Serratia phage vB_SmaM_ 2050HW]YP_009849169.1 hypothetical protein HWC48_gp073 [Serratia phage Moabite]QPX76743.1 hypothetical protein [Serratia phage vB_SmaM_Yaphecito]UCR74613.1 hypothetical protein [Serratia phage BUCT660]UGO54292.1 hypothetical protein HAYMO_310 [Serratia phage vB_SmaM_Haymo]UQT03474.1 hypothetical protein KODAMA_00050 [Serratia phage vB_SmaM-Kodama]ATA65684.1 hypothetical protein 2050HW_00349 [Serratia phage vB_SmaM_ 2050HW]